LKSDRATLITQQIEEKDFHNNNTSTKEVMLFWNQLAIEKYFRGN